MYAPGTRRHIKAALKAGATVEEIMEVLKLCVVRACRRAISACRSWPRNSPLRTSFFPRELVTRGERDHAGNSRRARCYHRSAPIGQNNRIIQPQYEGAGSCTKPQGLA